eukprot:scaffold128673_cov29-Attheya_sp.AAC.6
MPTYKEDRMKTMKQFGLTVALMLSTHAVSKMETPGPTYHVQKKAITAGGPTENNLKEPIEESFGGLTPFLKSPEDEEANAAASEREPEIKSSKSAKASKSTKSFATLEPSSAPLSSPSCFELVIDLNDCASYSDVWYVAFA